MTGYISSALMPISYRLGLINSDIRRLLISDLQGRTDLDIARDLELSQPFLEKYAKLNEKQRALLDIGLFNNDKDFLNEVLDKYNLTEEYKSIQDVLDNLFKEAKDAGVDLNYIESYFPRKVLDSDAYFDYLKRNDDELLSDLDRQIDRVNKKRVKEGKDPLNESQIINYINKSLYNRQKLINQGKIQGRTVDFINEGNIIFYADSIDSLLTYINNMHKMIAKQKFFGKNVDIDGDLSNTIGAKVQKLNEQGKIKAEDMDALEAMLNSFSIKNLLI